MGSHKTRSKTFIVFKREYLQRLKSKGFILSTILGPVALAAAIGIPVATTVLLEDDTKRVIHVVNQAGLDLNDIELPDAVEMVASEVSEDSLRELVLANQINGYLLLPEGLLRGDQRAKFASKSGGGLQFKFELQNAVQNVVREARLRAVGVGDDVIQILESEVVIDGVRLSEQGEGADSSGLLAVLGGVMAMMIYVTVFLYGSLVMRSVIEEKTNRIVEIVISSVRPFQLMLGKVFGVGAIGLTQLLIWLAAFFLIVTAFGVLLASTTDLTQLDPSGVEAATSSVPVAIGIPDIPALMVVYFVLFFIGGYLLYASVFAMIGSLVEQESDAQQFMLPVAVPIILSLLFLTRVIEAPDSTLSIAMSYIPLFSPVLMPVRGVVTQLAVWEIPLALLLLFATFAGAIWFCARIYRVGILMYGKRASFSDIVKWARMA